MFGDILKMFERNVFTSCNKYFWNILSSSWLRRRNCPTVVDEPENYVPTLDFKLSAAFHLHHFSLYVNMWTTDLKVNSVEIFWHISCHPEPIRLFLCTMQTPESLPRFWTNLNISLGMYHGGEGWWWLYDENVIMMKRFIWWGWWLSAEDEGCRDSVTSDHSFLSRQHFTLHWATPNTQQHSALSNTWHWAIPNTEQHSVLSNTKQHLTLSTTHSEQH